MARTARTEGALEKEAYERRRGVAWSTTTLGPASQAGVIHSPLRSVVPLCTVRWPVSCHNLSFTPCVFSLDSLSVKKTLYRTLYAV